VKAPSSLRSVGIVGAGPAGNAAAEMLRRRGFEGAVTLIGAEDPDARALIAYRKGGRILAVATVFMDPESLAIEAAFERGDLREVERIVNRVS
jgi:flavin-dependent dehydrogenase